MPSSLTSPSSSALNIVERVLSHQQQAQTPASELYWASEILAALTSPSLDESLRRRDALLEKGLTPLQWLKFALESNNPSLLNGIPMWPWSQVEPSRLSYSDADSPAYRMLQFEDPIWFNKAFETGLNPTERIRYVYRMRDEERGISLLEQAVNNQYAPLVEELLTKPAIQADQEALNYACFALPYESRSHLPKASQVELLKHFSPTFKLKTATDSVASLKVWLLWEDPKNPTVLNYLKTLSKETLDDIFHQESAWDWCFKRSHKTERSLKLALVWDKKRKWERTTNRLIDVLESCALKNFNVDFWEEKESFELLKFTALLEPSLKEPKIDWTAWSNVVKTVFQETVHGHLDGEKLQEFLTWDITAHLDESARQNWESVGPFFKKLARSQAVLDNHIWGEKVQLSLKVLEKASSDVQKELKIKPRL